jgi:hypothetical protein
MKINDIKKWFEVALPEPTIEQACIQVGCHYEEVAEMADSLGDFVSVRLASTGLRYKHVDQSYLAFFEDLDKDKIKVELLDSLCDQIVTAIGIAHTLGMDIEGALENVNASNFSKFENGQPVFNEHGKIAKGRDYVAPDLRAFV